MSSRMGIVSTHLAVFVNAGYKELTTVTVCKCGIQRSYGEGIFRHGDEPLGGVGVATDNHTEYYHISTVCVQLNLEVIEAEGDSKRTSRATIRYTHFVGESEPMPPQVPNLTPATEP
jgi:hypothetical protein